MKLASLNDGTRDGQLIVVNRNLTKAVMVPNIAKTMQALLDDWDKHYDAINQVYQDLNNNKLANVFDFDQKSVYSPLPRAYHWADGSAYLNHVELVRKARGAEMPQNFWTDPLMYQGGSDTFLAPYEDIIAENLEYGVDFEAEVAVITKDVPMSCDSNTAANSIILVALVNDVSLRNLIPSELAKGFGFYNSKPSSSFSPVAVTIDELGDKWVNGKLNLPLCSELNNNFFGNPNAGVDMNFSFIQLIQHAAKTRKLAAGTIIGSGTVSNKNRSVGSSCLAEKRMIEIIENGQAETPFMQYGDNIKIEMFDDNNKSIFGSICQTVVSMRL